MVVLSIIVMGVWPLLVEYYYYYWRALPSGANGSVNLHIYIYVHDCIYIYMDRPFWPPGGPALRANVHDIACSNDVENCDRPAMHAIDL